jgi:F-type H+-transporting ATPase subunit delta
MSAVKIEAYATALFEIAQADGTLALVEDELFRVARAFESNEQLRNTLSDSTIPADRRQQVAEQLLGAKASNTTTQLVSLVIGSGQVRDCQQSSTHL